MKPKKKIKVMKPDQTVIEIMPHLIKGALKKGFQVVPEPVENSCPDVRETALKTESTLTTDCAPPLSVDMRKVDLSKGIREIKLALKTTKEDLNELLEKEKAGKNRQSLITLIKKQLNG